MIIEGDGLYGDYNFEVVELRWTKRRPTDVKPVVEHCKVFYFDKLDNAEVVVEVKYENDNHIYTLTGRVNVNVVYEKIDGVLKKEEGRWTVNAFNAHGQQVMLRLVE